MGAYIPLESGRWLGLLLPLYGYLLVVGVVSYVFMALGLYTLAKRRGVGNPWLSWVPVAWLWVLGSLADQYDLRTQGRRRNQRSLLVWLGAGSAVGGALLLAALLPLLHWLARGPAHDRQALASLPFLLLLLLLELAVLVVSMAGLVLEYIALYKLFASCDRESTAVYLILSILAPLACPLLIYAFRNKDAGLLPPPGPGFGGPPPPLRTLPAPPMPPAPAKDPRPLMPPTAPQAAPPVQPGPTIQPPREP